jgi:hypothetical protein
MRTRRAASGRRRTAAAQIGETRGEPGVVQLMTTCDRRRRVARKRRSTSSWCCGSSCWIGSSSRKGAGILREDRCDETRRRSPPESVARSRASNPARSTASRQRLAICAVRGTLPGPEVEVRMTPDQHRFERRCGKRDLRSTVATTNVRAEFAPRPGPRAADPAASTVPACAARSPARVCSVELFPRRCGRAPRGSARAPARDRDLQQRATGHADREPSQRRRPAALTPVHPISAACRADHHVVEGFGHHAWSGATAMRPAMISPNSCG